MEKHIKKIIIILIIFIICIGILVYYDDYAHDSVKVGKTYFTLPSGYTEVGSLNNSVNISDGNTTIGIMYYDDANINKHIDNYINMKNASNVPINKTEYMINNIQVYKTQIPNETSVLHYWFINDNKVYEICTFSGTQNTDKIVFEFISTIKTFI